MPRRKELIATSVESMAGWAGLSAAEQSAVRKEHGCLLDEFGNLGKAWLAIGEHLANIRDVLAPKELFDEYLKLTPFGLARATAYRRIRMYEHASTVLPKPVMQVAMVQGMDRLPEKAVKELPPPKTENVQVITEYLHKLKEHTRSETSGDSDPEAMRKECVAYVRTRFLKLPANWTGKKKAEWVTGICGMMLTMLGVANPQSIAPIAIPEMYLRGPGRPALKKAS